MEKKSFLLVFWLLTTNLVVEAQFVENERTNWFIGARFGMFIHWDMSSVAGTEISWSRKGSKPLDITGDPAGYVADPAYDELYKEFNPSSFNATEWVEIAKSAGMKYIVFTAKHHDGFSMWDTDLSDYSIMKTPYAKDVVQQLASACRKAGLKFGLYYSQRDWFHPHYGIGDNVSYLDFMNAQLTELLSKYGQIDMLWWDSYGKGDLVKFWQVEETYSLVKRLQPHIIMNNRLAILADYNQQPKEYIGDWDTPEQIVGKFQNTRPWESCMTLVTTPDGGGWSYRPDGKLRSFKECIQTLVGCATGDGNLLLGVGPDANGVIPKEQERRLQEIGKWLKKYGLAIYNTTGGPYKNGKWGGSTVSGNKIFLHVLQWDRDQLILPPLPTKIRSCTNLTDRSKKISFTQNGDAWRFTLPIDQQDPINTVIMLELADQLSAEKIGKMAIDVPTN